MKKIILVLVVAGIVCSCSSDKGGDDRNPQLSRINIEGARSLFISSGVGTSKLYGIKASQNRSGDEDQVFEIKYFDQNGQEMSYNEPKEIFNTSHYVILSFDYDQLFLVSKTNGKVFSMPYQYKPDDNTILEDEKGHIYYIAWVNPKHILYRVSTTNPSELEIKQMSAVNDNVYGFYITANEALIYNVYSATGSPSTDMKYRKADGSYVAIDGEYEPTPGVRITNYFPFWRGTDDKTYCVYRKNTTSPAISKSYYIAELTTEGIIEPVKEIAAPNNYSFGFVQLAEKSYLMDYSSGTLTLHDVSTPEDYNEINISFSHTPKTIIEDKLYYFSQHDLSLTYIDVDAASTSVVYDLNETQLSAYSLDKIMEVTTTGITFSAVDLSDGSYVVAKMNLDNSITVKSSLSGEIVSILSLN